VSLSGSTGEWLSEGCFLEEVGGLMSVLKEHDDHRQKNGVASYNVVYMSSYYGSIQIEECSKCGYIIVVCEHIHNEWNEDGTQLICRLCGSDGT
jgi:hypothetical protein